MSVSATPKSISLATLSLSQGNLKLENISGASVSLKTRLLEVGLTQGTPIKVRRNGGHYLIKLRGDTLLLRTHEAQCLMVSMA